MVDRNVFEGCAISRNGHVIDWDQCFKLMYGKQAQTET
jgi:hypothetical protein